MSVPYLKVIKLRPDGHVREVTGTLADPCAFLNLRVERRAPTWRRPGAGPQVCRGSIRDPLQQGAVPAIPGLQSG